MLGKWWEHVGNMLGKWWEHVGKMMGNVETMLETWWETMFLTHDHIIKLWERHQFSCSYHPELLECDDFEALRKTLPCFMAWNWCWPKDFGPTKTWICWRTEPPTNRFPWVLDFPLPIGSMYCMLYLVTFTINIPQMLAYISYMDPMGWENQPSPFTKTQARRIPQWWWHTASVGRNLGVANRHLRHGNQKSAGQVKSGWWLLLTPPKNHGVKVSWDDDIVTFPTEWENKSHGPNHQPVWDHWKGSPFCIFKIYSYAIRNMALNRCIKYIIIQILFSDSFIKSAIHGLSISYPSG